jgi:Asp-tRNA(Asn)/Glu-tRNA(Gln) amidotransferase A subunit family amidase
MLAGAPMMDGASTLEGFAPDGDATIAIRLPDADAAIKVRRPANISAPRRLAPLRPRAAKISRNPTHPVGGSPSGSAASLAAGEIDPADGGDRGGSSRMPSVPCGTCGMTPRPGLTPYTSVMPIELGVDHTGPMAKSVSERALLPVVLSDYDQLLMPTPPIKATPRPTSSPTPSRRWRARRPSTSPSTRDGGSLRHGRRPADQHDAGRQAFRRERDLPRSARLRAGGGLEEPLIPARETPDSARAVKSV